VPVVRAMVTGFSVLAWLVVTLPHRPAAYKKWRVIGYFPSARGLRASDLPSRVARRDQRPMLVWCPRGIPGSARG